MIRFPQKNDARPREWNLSSDDGEMLIKYLLYRLDKLDDMCKIIYENKSK